MDDEALARRLQEEEERLHAGSRGAARPAADALKSVRRPSLKARTAHASKSTAASAARIPGKSERSLNRYLSRCTLVLPFLPPIY